MERVLLINSVMLQTVETVLMLIHALIVLQTILLPLQTDVLLCATLVIVEFVIQVQHVWIVKPLFFDLMIINNVIAQILM